MSGIEAWVKRLLDAPRVRVWNGTGSAIMAEGRPIAVCTDPTITIEDDDGVRHHCSLALRTEIEHREWKPR